jgi:hypothetical protein
MSSASVGRRFCKPLPSFIGAEKPLFSGISPAHPDHLQHLRLQNQSNPDHQSDHSAPVFMSLIARKWRKSTTGCA